jgi:adenosylhomocysteine nucleosidase
VKTWLLVAAERREFDGIGSRFGKTAKLGWPGVEFAQEVEWQGDRWWMVANGPGPALVLEALAEKKNVDGIISTGLCGALDPALRVGDIVVSGDAAVDTQARCVRGAVFSIDHVAVTAAEKRTLRNQTGAVAVDMEAAAVQRKAAEWNLPFLCIRAVSDRAGDTLPLDFNRYRNARGDFSRTRIALAAMARPFTVMPQLIEFDRNCRRAADALGDFLADCRF